MGTSTTRRPGGTRSRVQHAIRLSVIAAGATVVAAATARADTSYYYQGGTNGIWDNATPDWATPLSSSLPLTDWTSSSTSDAYFSTGGIIVNVNSNVAANILNFDQSGSVAFAGSGTITLNQINNTVASQTIDFVNAISSPGQLVIQGIPYPVSNGKGIELGADTNYLPGGVLLTGGSVYLNLDNSAQRFAVDPTELGGVPASSLNSPGNIPGSTKQTGPILLTSISGAGGTFPAITVDGNGSTITLGNIHSNDYVLPNAVVLNPSNQANFYVALGGGSVADSGSVVSGPYPAYASMNFAGQISGNGNVIISNDFYGGGGKGYTVFSNPNNNYTGQTIINNNAQNYLTFQVGAQGAIPATSDLVFGATSLGKAIGATKITGKQVGAFDMNGFNVTVKSLSSDMPGNLYDLGITAVNNHAIDPNLTSGTNTTCVLTIDSAGSLNNTFFSGNIADGTDFLTQANATSGAYQGPYKGAASNYLPPSAGLKVGISLAPTNKGTLTLSATNGPLAPDYGYTGGTTVHGGSLYVNGNLTAPSGIAASQVLVTTPIAGNIALLGGTGNIAPDIHIQSGAILAPGSTPLKLASGSGSSFSNAPSSFGYGTMTVHNLTLDGGSELNFVIDDGSSTAILGGDYGTLAFSSGGQFTEDASVSAADPIYIHPAGSFAGFANYQVASWTLATFPTGSNLANMVLDSRNGYSPVPTGLLGNGTFSLTENAGSLGTTLSLVFTPLNAYVIQYSGPTNGTWNSDAGNTVWFNVLNNTGNIGYSDGANVVFSTPSASSTITVQAGGVAPDSVVFSNAATFNGAPVSYTLAGGSINDAGPAAPTTFTLNGTGHVILTAPNAFSGGTAISGNGVLETQVSGALGNGTIAIKDGTWAITNDQTYANNIQVLGNAGFSSPTVSVIQTGPTTGIPSGNLTLNGNIAGSGTLTKTGVGTLTVNGTLGQSGDLHVNAGRMLVNGLPAFAGTTSVLAGATLEYNSPANATIGYAPTANLAGNIVFDTLTNVTFSPGTYAATGNLVLAANGSLIQGVGGVLGGSPVDIGNTIVMNPSDLPNFVAYVGMAGDGNRFWLHGAITGDGDVQFGNGPQQHGGADIDLFARSTYSGNTIIDTGNSAVLTINTDNALPATTQLIFGEDAQGSGSFDLNGHSQTVATLATDPLGGNFGGLQDSAGGGTLTVNGAVSSTFNARITGILTLNVALQNNAVLTLAWNGNNNGVNFGNVYGGQTNVTGGVLRFDNALAFSPNQNTVLNGGVLEINAANFGDLTNTLGSLPNQIQVTGGTSGFSVYGTAPGNVNLNGGGTITWGSSSFNPSVLVLNQSTATNALNFKNNIDFGGADRAIAVNSIASGTAATISGNLVGTGGLNKTGPGTLILAGSNSYAGDTTVSGGTLVAPTVHAIGSGSLTVHAAASAILQPGFSSALALSGLSLDGASNNWTGHLDIANNKLVIQTISSNVSSVLPDLENAATFGKTHTAGITAAVEPANFGIAVVRNGDLPTPFASFGNVPVTSDNILVTSAVYGDINLDGKVDASDLAILASHWLQPSNHNWGVGDFTGSGTVDASDLALMSQNWLFGTTGAGVSFASALAGFPAITSAVPEPASVLLLGLGAAALMSRRRRNA